MSCEMQSCCLSALGSRFLRLCWQQDEFPAYSPFPAAAALRRIKAETQETSPSQLMLQQAERKPSLLSGRAEPIRSHELMRRERREDRRTDRQAGRETAAYFVSNSIRFVSIWASSGAAAERESERASMVRHWSITETFEDASEESELILSQIVRQFVDWLTVISSRQTVISLISMKISCRMGPNSAGRWNSWVPQRLMYNIHVWNISIQNITTFITQILSYMYTRPPSSSSSLFEWFIQTYQDTLMHKMQKERLKWTNCINCVTWSRSERVLVERPAGSERVVSRTHRLCRWTPPTASGASGWKAAPRRRRWETNHRRYHRPWTQQLY